MLLLSKYNDKTVNVDMESNLLNIENAYEMFGMWEKSLVRFAHYQDRILNTMASSVYYTKGLLVFNIYIYIYTHILENNIIINNLNCLKIF